jgi:hypothetical protein
MRAGGVSGVQELFSCNGICCACWVLVHDLLVPLLQGLELGSRWTFTASCKFIGWGG